MASSMALSFWCYSRAATLRSLSHNLIFFAELELELEKVKTPELELDLKKS